jgi:hypothetical protein
VSSYWLPGNPALVTPYYSQPNLSWVQVIDFPDPTQNTGFTYTVPGDFFDIITLVSMSIGIANQPATRLAVIELVDQNDTVLWRIPNSLSASHLNILPLTWTPSSSSFESVTDDCAVAPLPLTLAQPGWVFSVSFVGGGANDIVESASITVTHIPTGIVGSSLDAETPATPSSTPILV